MPRRGMGYGLEGVEGQLGVVFNQLLSVDVEVGCGVVEDVAVVVVVVDLEYDTVVIAKVVHGLAIIGGVGAVHGVGPQFATGGHEGGRLASYDVEIVVLVQCLVVEGQLFELAFAHDGDGGVDDVGDLVVVDVVERLHGLGEQVVATEYGCLIAPLFSYSSVAAPGVGLVHHIVVHQGGVVKQLHDGGDEYMLRFESATCLG